MKATIKQAQDNERNLRIQGLGYGRWRITMDYRNRRIGTNTTDAQAIDDFYSVEGEVDETGTNRRKKGYEALCSLIIARNNF